MGTNIFLDFDLLIEPQASGFRARILKSPVGEGTHDFSLPFAPPELDAVFALFGRTAPAAPRTQRAADLAREFGAKLFDAVFAAQIKSSYSSSAQFAATQNAGLRIRLRLNNVPALADAPWELLYDGADFLALQPQRALVRYLELPQPIKPLAVTPPLRALVVLSSPSDYETLDVASEWEHLNDALADVVSTGLFEIELLEQPTLTALQNQLRRNTYHILHFSGHGEFDDAARAQSKGMLVFQDEHGIGQGVDALTLARHLAEHTTLRLVVLNACEGARASTRDAFTGAAQTLMRQNIPAVIAMQFEITDDAAQNFAYTLYGALANQASIDAAVSEARKRLAHNAASLEWATPVLFTRAEDGNLFARESLDVNTLRTLERVATLRIARDLFARGKWMQALRYTERALEKDPHDTGARYLKQRIQREQELEQLYQQGEKTMNDGRWLEALSAFQRVQTLRYYFRQTVEYIQIAKHALYGQEDPTPIQSDPNETHYKNVIKELLRGRIIPFFGQSVNLFGRPAITDWQHLQDVPSGGELAQYLANNFDYDLADNSNLVRVSQYIVVMKSGNSELFEEIHSILAKDSMPTPLHRFWAELPALLRAHGVLPQLGEQPSRGESIMYPILFTANYDDLLERALHDADEPFDVLIYLADGENRGKFLHRMFEGTEKLVTSPNDYPYMRLDERTTIVKVHGAIHREQPERDSFVITEDHYIKYLKENIRELLPQTVNMRIARSYGLFMGCDLRNWALRGVLYQLGKTDRHPWVVHPNASNVDTKYWNMLNVDLLNLSLEEFIAELAARLMSVRTHELGRSRAQ